VQVLNLLDGVKVEPDSSASSFQISAQGDLRTRKAVQGLGVLYFYWSGGAYSPRQAWNKSLYLPKQTALGVANEPSVNVRFADKFPCCGAVSPELGGFLVAPTVKLDVAEGKEIAAMLISPNPTAGRVSIGKQSLSIPADGSEAKILLSADGGLNCNGTVHGSNISGELLLTRNSNPPISGLAISEELAKVKDSSAEITASWRPVTRTFEELLFVFHPGDVNLGDLDELVEHVGASTETFDETGVAPFVVGDGPEATYTLRLALKRHHRSDATDETVVKVA
jgi:hypothetical protein